MATSPPAITQRDRIWPPGHQLRRAVTLAQQHFNVGEMKKLLVALPGIGEQARLVAAVTAAAERLDSEVEQLTKLRTLKQGLMDDLLTGRVRVPVPSEAPA